ncbi:OmpA family protein [Phaeodactylibacter luteus]|uniref:OmpA family protein n=2 Tax=Phaeodactylibacter luteus TaxID=1564516 RepID=A0A5C6S017_9BACT|nr:OmpA family protein [Phaeodactylibacter luteus]
MTTTPCPTRLIISFIAFFTLLWPAPSIFAQAAEGDSTSMKAIRAHQRLQIGLQVGASSDHGDLSGTRVDALLSPGLAFGALARYQISPNLSIRGSIWRGQLSSTDADNEALASRGYSFEADYTELALMGEWNFLGHRRFLRNGKFKPGISPYIFAGAGATVTSLATRFQQEEGTLTEGVQQDLLNQRTNHITIPVGAGVQADLGPSFGLAIEFGLRPVFNDYLDGLSLGGGPNADDWYSTGAVQLTYRFGPKDSDLDGITDAKDQCPRDWGLAAFDGCPDEGSRPEKDLAPAMAGHTRFQFGLQAGAASDYGDMAGSRAEALSTPDLAYGAFLRYQAAPSISIRGQVLAGSLSSADAENEKLSARGYSFEAGFTEVALLGEWDLRGSKRHGKGGRYIPIVSPYVFAGVGAAFTDLATDFAGEEGQIKPPVLEDLRNQREQHVVLPFGAGLRADLGQQLTLGLEFGLRPVLNDYLDGLSLGGGPNANDWYSTATLQAAYRFGAKDSDLDGIADRKDECPGQRGLAQFNGCPDTDDDGVPNREDKCPDLAGLAEAQGCPDADGDGIGDPFDECPDEAGRAATNGCPDRDFDGVTDAEDECPDIAGLVEMKGCRDTDKDGIADPQDQCPYIPGVAEFYGCPIPDRDNDGFLNEVDRCPDTPGTFNGCPDTDNDGLPDDQDECPDLAGPKENYGCPVLNEADLVILETAIDEIKFTSSSYALLRTSYPVLGQIADLMRKYPTYNLEIAGYTDNQGNDFANQQLSEFRAKACFDYLHNEQGIPKERMSYRGFGETNPRATNDTISGRNRNRRVEFDLVPGSLERRKAQERN